MQELNSHLLRCAPGGTADDVKGLFPRITSFRSLVRGGFFFHPVNRAATLE